MSRLTKIAVAVALAAAIIVGLALTLPAEAFASSGGWGTQNSGSTAYLTSLNFPDASHGWAAGANTILATTDGGVPAPTLTGFAPTSGPVGSSVTLSGTGFSGATAVDFNGLAAPRAGRGFVTLPASG
jgi:hypothetical protein